VDGVVVVWESEKWKEEHKLTAATACGVSSSSSSKRRRRRRRRSSGGGGGGGSEVIS